MLTSVVAFILYRQHHHSDLVAQHPGLPNPEISKIAGHLWTKEPDSVKGQWKGLAEVCNSIRFHFAQISLTPSSEKRLVTPNSTPITDFSLNIKPNGAVVTALL
jgi:hypothetical protein